MKTNFKTLILLSSLLLVAFVGCKKEEDEGEELEMEFKMESGYTHSDATLPGGTDVKIGIEAETEKKKDPIIKFNISESVDNGAASSVYEEDLEDHEFEYDYQFTLDTTSGSEHKYTFTVTNKDGFNEQKSLTLTVE